ncbi:retrotransposon hot spot (RHS) protein [Trypanosoma cruzi]|nr:retrotransposon hot spot (RHS) protein [Trypanosoma cruzi]
MPGNQASAVPQGDVQRRASPESEDVTDQPAATQIRLEEARRTQWTMSSTVEDILLEGSTNRNEMRLNDFLRSNLGGRGVVDTNENVAMEMFVLRPTMFINDSEILGIITASPSYQELEKRKNYWRLFISFNTRVCTFSSNGRTMKERIRSLHL